jgi:hypothetical protein
MRRRLNDGRVEMFRRRYAFWSLIAIVFAALFFAGSSAAASDGPIVILESPADGWAFYQGQQVQAAYLCLPGPLGSPVIVCDGDVPLGDFVDTSSVGTHTFTVHAVDYSGAETTLTHTYTVFDVIPPTATVATPADHAVYPQGAQILVHYACDDGPGGSGIAGCIAPLPDGAPLPTNQLGTFTFTVDAFDLAGNHGSTTVTYTIADLTPPTITITSPADGAQFLLGQVVTPQYSCHDDVDGSRVLCKATPIDTSTYGQHTFRVDSTDSSGNTSSATTTYYVVYNFSGFFAPLAPEPTISTVKGGEDLPVKFSLNGNQGLDIFAAQPAWRSGCTSGAADTVPASGSLSYNASVDRYVFLAKTERAWAGSCRQLIVTLRDGTVHRANVSFR